MTDLIVLNEFTALRALWAAAVAARPVILAVEPLLPPSAGLLERLRGWLLASGRARPASAVILGYRSLETYPTRILFHDVCRRTEAWQNAWFRLAQADQDIPDYAYAYRHHTSNFMGTRHHAVRALEMVEEQADAAAFRVVGASPETLAAFRSLLGRPPRLRAPQRRLPGRRLVNLFQAALLTLIGVAWVACRCRPRPPRPETFFFAADYLSDPRDDALFPEIEEGGPLLIVPRNAQHVDRARRLHPAAAIHGYGETRFGPAEAARAIRLLFCDGAGLWRAFGGDATAHFFQTALLPFRRIRIRGFLASFTPRFFWGRDDYNTEHVLRRQELHRVGGISLGLNHGYSHYSNHYPMWRYISFDRYFAFGRAQYNRYMKESWAPDMDVIASGSFGAFREDYVLKDRERPRDIGIFAAAFVNEPGMVALVRALAAAFPERTVWLQVKNNFVDTEDGRAFVAQCTDGVANVRHTRDPIFAIFHRVTYGFSDPSTVVVEALQFNVISFMTDVSPIQRVSLFREFDGLCVRSGAEAVARIRAIEAGSWRYPRDTFGELVDLSGRPFFDAVRAAVGLPERGAHAPSLARAPRPGRPMPTSTGESLVA